MSKVSVAACAVSAVGNTRQADPDCGAGVASGLGTPVDEIKG